MSDDTRRLMHRWPDKRCENCQFAKPATGYDAWKCGRMAPSPLVVPNTGGTMFRGEWPTVAGNDWCGEWARFDGDTEQI